MNAVCEGLVADNEQVKADQKACESYYWPAARILYLGIWHKIRESYQKIGADSRADFVDHLDNVCHQRPVWKGVAEIDQKQNVQ